MMASVVFPCMPLIPKKRNHGYRRFYGATSWTCSTCTRRSRTSSNARKIGGRERSIASAAFSELLKGWVVGCESLIPGDEQKKHSGFDMCWCILIISGLSALKNNDDMLRCIHFSVSFTSILLCLKYSSICCILFFGALTFTRLREKKSRISASMAKMKSESMEPPKASGPSWVGGFTIEIGVVWKTSAIKHETKTQQMFHIRHLALQSFVFL